MRTHPRSITRWSVPLPGRRLLLAAALFPLMLVLAGCASQIDTAISVLPDGSWSGEAGFSFAVPAQAAVGWQDQLDLQVDRQAADLLDNLGVGYTRSRSAGEGGDVTYTFGLEGKELSALSKLLANMDAAAEVLGGTARLEVTAPVQAGQEVRLAVPGNLTTGYTWAVDTTRTAGLEPLGGVESRQITEGQGTQARQVVRLRAARTGLATLVLAYRRPWLPPEAPTRTYVLRADELGLAPLLAAVSLPEPAPAPSLPASPPAGEANPAAGSEGATPDLPSSFNWCNQGGCTPVKDQGACGACWAFGTVAPLESAIKLEDGVTTDLSEQYLVSCNTDDWSCSGGWRAHDYHWFKYSAPETQAGAVYESSFPYVASDTACGGPYGHPYRIVNWDYVAGYTVPSVAALKQALYDFGPLSISVCAGPLWNSYSGGVLTTDESAQCAPSYSNHTITLVGWNDADGAWVIKNSWGPAWGESGYMRIKYGISNVGYAAAYIEYTPAAPMDVHLYLPLVVSHYPPIPYTPTLNDISNADGDGNYTVSWSAAALASTYQLQEDDNSSFSSPFQPYTGSATSVNITAQPVGTWFYRVHACNGYGCSPWSSVKSTTVNPAGGWQTLVSTNFEGSFPGVWDVFDNGQYSGEYYWGKRNCRSYSGSYSGWGVGAGANGSGLSCGSNYPSNAESWMIYGPFSLADAAAAELSFQLWLNAEYCEEEWCDGVYWGASLDGQSFHGYYVNGSGDGLVTFDLAAAPDPLGDLRGQPQVWVALVFFSDAYVTYAEGGYVDDILLRKYVGAEAAPADERVPALPPEMKLKEGSLSVRR